MSGPEDSRPTENTGESHARRWWPWSHNGKPAADGNGAYRGLAMQLHLDMGEVETGRCILLTSPTDPAVCHRPALELACFLAKEMGQRVLVVDASFNRRDLSHEMRCEEHAGFLDLLDQQPGSTNGLVQATEVERVFLLPAGNADVGLGKAMQGKRVASALESLRKDYDYVLVLAPPVLADASSLVLPPLVDCVLLLAVEGESRLDDVDASQESLAACKARRVGLVLTPPAKHRGRTR